MSGRYPCATDPGVSSPAPRHRGGWCRGASVEVRLSQGGNRAGQNVQVAPQDVLEGPTHHPGGEEAHRPRWCRCRPRGARGTSPSEQNAPNGGIYGWRSVRTTGILSDVPAAGGAYAEHQGIFLALQVGIEQPTRRPSRCRARRARFTATVVSPTPPLPLATARTATRLEYVQLTRRQSSLT